MNHSLQLHQYNVWANKKMLDHLKQLPEDVYQQEVKSVFPSVKAVLIHMYQVDYVWLKVLQGETFEQIVVTLEKMFEDLNGATLHEMAEKFDDMSSKYKAFIQEKGDLTAQTTVHHPHFGTLDTSYAELVTHIANHGTYHRGQVSAILNQQGQKGFPTDYIFYLFSLQEA
jgi:uncharacterized damage-inducible protein DinB